MTVKEPGSRNDFLQALVGWHTFFKTRALLAETVLKMPNVTREDYVLQLARAQILGLVKMEDYLEMDGIEWQKKL